MDGIASNEVNVSAQPQATDNLAGDGQQNIPQGQQTTQADGQQATVHPEENPLLDFLSKTGSKWYTQAQNNPATDQPQQNDTQIQQTQQIQQLQEDQTQQIQPTQQAQQTQQPEGQPSQKDGPAAIPEKFRNPDGSLNAEALLKSYGALEQKLGERGNQLGQIQSLQQKVEELMGIIQSQQQATQQQGQIQLQDQQGAPAPQPLTEEQIAQLNEQFLQDYYENPIKTMNSLVSIVAQNAIQSALQPLMAKIEPVVSSHEQSVQMQKWSSQAEEVAKTNPQEFEELKPLMEQVINEQKDIIGALPDNVNKVQYVFNQAKAIKAQQQAAELAAQIKTPEQMLADPEFQKMLLQNEQIKQMFAQAQVEAIRQNKPPVVISNQPMGASPAAPAPDVKTIKDATPAAINFFKKVINSGF